MMMNVKQRIVPNAFERESRIASEKRSKPLRKVSKKLGFVIQLIVIFFTPQTHPRETRKKLRYFVVVVVVFWIETEVGVDLSVELEVRGRVISFLRV